MIRPKKCDICGKDVPGGHLARHKRRCHQKSQLWPSKSQIEMSTTVCQVNEAVGIRADELAGWDLEAFNSLPNMRHFQPAPRRNHTPWTVLPKSNVYRLPTFEALLLDVDRVLHDEVRREEAGQLPSGSTIVMLERQKSITWIRQVLEGQPTTTGILKLTMDSVTTEDELEEYAMYANKVAYQIYLPETTCELVRMSPEIHIVPRLNRLEVCRAKSPRVSTALGAAARGQVPLQLWIVWPSTELHRLAKCYGDTNTALLYLDHGCFFVQMPGETVAVPPNSPHAVLALDSFYSVGHRFDISDLAHDPPALYVDLACKLSMEDACEKRVTRLGYGLRDTKTRQAHIDQFMETWATESAVFRDVLRQEYFDKLVEVWADDMDWGRPCAWCSCIGSRLDQHLQINHFKHARAHLEGSKLESGER